MLVRVLDIGVMRLDHGSEIAMGEHGALGATGGTAGVEQPGEVIVCARTDLGRLVRQHCAISIRTDGDHLRAGSRQRAIQLRRDAGRGEDKGGRAIVDDLGNLARMELGVDRHDRQSGSPGSKEDLRHLRAIGAGDQHAVSGPGLARQCACQRERTPAQFGKAGELPGSMEHRPPVRVDRRDLVEKAEEIHPACISLALGGRM